MSGGFGRGKPLANERGDQWINSSRHNGQNAFKGKYDQQSYHNNTPKLFLPDPIIPQGTLKKCKVVHVHGPLLTIYLLPEDAKDQVDLLSKQMEDLGADDHCRVKHPRKDMLVRTKENGKWSRGVVFGPGYSTFLVDDGKVLDNTDRLLYFIDRVPELMKVPKCTVKCTIDQMQPALSKENMDVIRNAILGKEYFVYFEMLLEDKYKVSMHEVIPSFDPDSLFVSRAKEIQSFAVGSTLNLLHVKPQSQDGRYTGRQAGSKQMLQKLERQAKIIVQDFCHKLKFDAFSLKKGTLVMTVAEKRSFDRGVVTQETSDGMYVEVDNFDHNRTGAVKITDLYPLIKPFDQITRQAVIFKCAAGVTVPEIVNTEEGIPLDVVVSKVFPDGSVEVSSVIPHQKTGNDTEVFQTPKKKKKSSKKKNKKAVGGNKDSEANESMESCSSEENGSKKLSKEFMQLDDQNGKESKKTQFGQRVQPTFDKNELKNRSRVSVKTLNSVLFELDAAAVGPAAAPSLSVVSEEDSFVVDEQSVGIFDDEIRVEEEVVTTAITTAVSEVINKLVGEIESKDPAKVTVDLSNIDLDETILASYTPVVDKSSRSRSVSETSAVEVKEVSTVKEVTPIEASVETAEECLITF